MALPARRWGSCGRQIARGPVLTARLELANMEQHGPGPAEPVRRDQVRRVAWVCHTELTRRRQIDFETNGKQYKLVEKPAVLIVR